VLEFDAAGTLIQAWGPIHGDGDKGEPNATARGIGPPGPWLLGKQVWGPYPEIGQDLWPGHEHGILVDYKDRVWVGDAFAPSHILTFTRDGKKLLMQLGQGGPEEAKSNTDTTRFAGPTGIVVDRQTNEVFVADGYRNRRVIVFDADTGAYKRMWGAYGNPPADPLGSNPIEGKYNPNVRSKQFATAHCLMMSVDRLLYVCDRINNRVQVFRTDGTFVREAVIAPNTRGVGAVHALGFSADKEQRFAYVGDGANKKVWILRRADLAVLGSFGYGGRGGGQFGVIHALAVDSKGNVYVGETRNLNRVQKFRFVGLRPPVAQ
jgi:DNA-binding beta-propeller fold protein YncE